MMYRGWIGALALLGLVGAGCGGDGLKRVSVRGKVTAGGVPVDKCTVQFLPLGSTKGQGGLGNTDQDGNFKMASGTLSGIVPGEYKVRLGRYIAPNGQPATTREDLMQNPYVRDSIPPKYSGMNSPLRFTVPESGGEINIDIPEKLLPFAKGSP
jgi:hypothetical protein